MKSRAIFFLLALFFWAIAVLPQAARAQGFQAKGKPSPPASGAGSKSGGGGSVPDLSSAGWGTSVSDFGGGEQAVFIPLPLATDLGALAQLPAAILASAVDATNPQGVVIGANYFSLTRGADAWTPVMGEFQYARCPPEEWRNALLKMKSGGVDIVSTNVFWIFHEEREGKFTWGGERDLRRFVQTCAEAGMQVMLRIGPWCRGGARNGGLPDWLVAGGSRLRSDDPRYMDKVRVWFGEIGAQVKGLLWKDGGPVMGVQLESEYPGPGAHLLALKQLAVDSGISAPLYFRTGAPAPTSPLPFGEILPLWGAWAEGYWDRDIAPMPGNYWKAFSFGTMRDEDGFVEEQPAPAPEVSTTSTTSHTLKPARQYPYLTGEVGTGMVSSYHRRIAIDARDTESLALVKLGSGSVSTGYYLYHGGVNPDSVSAGAGGAPEGIPLAETQSSGFTNWNDLPAKNYDFQAPLGAAGQARAAFALLRRQNLFMHDFGHLLAGKPTVLPASRPSGKADKSTLRWAIRTDGRSGFIFVNNYQRGMSMPARQGVQFALNLPPVESVSPIPSNIGLKYDEGLSAAEPDAKRRAAVAQAVSKRMVPVSPVDVPANSSFILPFNMDLGDGAILAYALAQPLCFVDTPDRKVRTYFFSEIPGIEPELAFTDITVRVMWFGQGRQRRGDGLERITSVKVGHSRAVTLRSPSVNGKTIQIVVLPHADSLNLHKLAWGHNDRVIISPHPITIDTDETLRVHAPAPGGVKLLVYPLPPKEHKKKKSMLGRVASYVIKPLTDSIKEAGSIFTTINVPGAGPPSPPAAANPKSQNPKSPNNPKFPPGEATDLTIPNPKNEGTGAEGGARSADDVLSLAKLGSSASAVRVQKIRDAGPPRAIPKGRGSKPVPVAPTAADFAAAAAWKISLSPEWLARAQSEFARGSGDASAGSAVFPPGKDAKKNLGAPGGATQPGATATQAGRVTVASSVSLGDAYLKIHYTGDVARVLLDGKVVLDDFYNGRPLELPLKRFAAKLAAGATLTVEILPLRKDAPVLLPDTAWPRFGSRVAVAELSKTEIVQTFTHTLVPAAPDDDEDDDNGEEGGESMVGPAGFEPATKGL